MQECRPDPLQTTGVLALLAPGKALPNALSHTESHPGHSLQGYKDLALLAQPGLPARHLRSRAPPPGPAEPSAAVTVQLLLPAAFAPRRRGSRGARSVPAVRVQRTWPGAARWVTAAACCQGPD